MTNFTVNVPKPKKLPRYVVQQTWASGKSFYRYNPPQKYVDANIVQRINLGESLSEVRQKAKEFNDAIDEYVSNLEENISIERFPTLLGLSVEYKKSNDFNRLGIKTKKDYEYFLRVAMETMYRNKKVSDIKLKDFNGAVARQLYELWLNRGISMANHICAVVKKMYSFGTEMGYAETNPFMTFKMKSTHKRTVVWTQEQMRKFLDVAYDDFEYRNVGLIAQMASEWCQRIGDMRLLEWSNIDFNKGVLNLQQSKRRSIVCLPIEEDLLDMLVEQEKDFGFQKYVAPYTRDRSGEYVPYNIERISQVAKRIMRKAELPDNLWLMDFRRTGTTEMVEAGVPMGQIMSVTGHANPNSVKPYMKNTYASANSALKERKKYVDNH